MPTRTAAAPTKLCKAATSSGMAVICTRFASTAPIRPPTPMASASNAYDWTVPSAVMTRAINMPMKPKVLPRRAEDCALNPPRLKMNSTPAAR